MKKIGLFLVSLFICSFVTTAQDITKGTFHRLIIPQDIDFVLDFTAGVYRGLTYEELIKSECPGENSEQAWKVHEESLKNQFLKCFHEELPGYSFGSYANVATYRMTMRINHVTPKGNMLATFIVTSVVTGDVIVEFQANGDGGKWGSFLNLFGDGIRDLGEEVGSFFMKQVKKCR